MNNGEKDMLRSNLAYSEMVDDILDSIANKRLKAGQRIASEGKLKAQYNISITSIKRGLNVLVERGILQRRRGSGTFVANTDIILSQPLVRRDTIAIIRQWQYWRYHPFFSEQLKGVMAGLAHHGWKSHDIQCGNGEKTHNLPPDRDSSYRNLSSAMLKLELQQKPEIAGVIFLQCREDIVKAIADAGWTIVSTGPMPGLPFVVYDWDFEVEHLFRIALAKKARTLGVVSSFPLKKLKQLCYQAARALQIPVKTIKLIHFPIEVTQQSTELINRGYQLIKNNFSKETSIDGLVITGDFETLGVTDALSQLPREKWQNLPIISLLNKESKLQARIPMTTLIADGYAHGIAMTELLHEHLRNDGNYADNVILNCSQVEWK